MSLGVLSGVTGENILNCNRDGFSVLTAKQPFAPARLAAAALPRPSRAPAGVSEVYFTFFALLAPPKLNRKPRPLTFRNHFWSEGCD